MTRSANPTIRHSAHAFALTLLALGVAIGGGITVLTVAPADPASAASLCQRKPNHPKCSTPTPSPTSTASATPSASPSPSPTATATASPSGVCQTPVWTTSRAGDQRTWADPEGAGFPDGVGAYGQYMVDNNMWNAAGYSVAQTLHACDFDNWSVTTTANNATGDGAVKTYPNVHVDYIDWGTGRMQPLSDFSSLKMRYAHQAPTTAGIWNVAFDVWLNGIGNGSANELMIWTENHNQIPAGTKTATVTIGGVEWAFWKGYNGHYLAFVPTGGRVLPSGELDLIAFTDWLAAHGHIPTDSVLGQVDYGVEVVSTSGVPTRFDFTDFELTETLR